MVRPKALSQLLNSELRWGHREQAALATDKLQGTHWITTSNNVAWLCKQRETGQTYMQRNQRLSDSFWANVSGSLEGRKEGCKSNMLHRQREESQPKDSFHVYTGWEIWDMHGALQPHSHPWKAISQQKNLQFKWQWNVCLELSDQISNWDILGT